LRCQLGLQPLVRQVQRLNILAVRWPQQPHTQSAQREQQGRAGRQRSGRQHRPFTPSTLQPSTTQGFIQCCAIRPRKGLLQPVHGVLSTCGGKADVAELATCGGMADAAEVGTGSAVAAVDLPALPFALPLLLLLVLPLAFALLVVDSGKRPGSLQRPWAT
jgi:hypothetical protein